MKNKELQEIIKNDKNLANYSNETLKYVQTPIGKALFKTEIEEEKTSKLGRPKKEDRVKWSDRMICPICSRSILRSNQSSHKKSQYCQAHKRMNDNVRKMLLN
jgi:hypothetical protein